MPEEPSERFARSFTPSQPTPLAALESYEVPEKLSYRLKNWLLGRPLINEELSSERLGRPTALAILSSDVMSSSAYATEASLGVLIPAVGIAAYHLIVPVSLLVIVVLIFVAASYLEVIRAFPKAGGAYIVARETFGLWLAQIAAASLFIDYTLTVAVSVAAGVDAIASAIPALIPFITPIGVVFVIGMAFGNLRGLREAGRTFAMPTFIFIGSMLLMIAVGILRALFGHIHHYAVIAPGAFPAGKPGGGLLVGASVFIVLKSFASGGTALTGTEAISNGVSVFRDPQVHNARVTLIWMSVILGTLFLGVSGLAAVTHAVPYLSGAPTVLSQVAQAAFGQSPFGHVLTVILDISTTAILTLAANTSFTGFPLLASFAAMDGLLPRRFRERGHRLVYSTAIVIVAAVAIVLLVATNSNINSLISLYAIGVFTGFTIAGAGMVRHHFIHKEGYWRRRAVVNGSSAVLSAIVDIVFIVTKFTSGAWLVVVVVPLLVLLFTRFRRRFEREAAALEEGVAAACEAPAARTHVVLLFVDRVDLATARAVQYAKLLLPDALRAVHLVVDAQEAATLRVEWEQAGLANLELELVECPDRRLRRGAAEVVLDAVSSGSDVEVSAIVPHRVYGRILGPLLHDQSAVQISQIVGELPHATAILVPYRVRTRSARATVTARARRATLPTHAPKLTDGTTPISACTPRSQAIVVGRVAAVRTRTLDGVPMSVARLEDATGGILLVFPGRRQVPGIVAGATIRASGTVGEFQGRLAMMNPSYEFLEPAHQES